MPPVPRRAFTPLGAWLLIVATQALADVRTSPHNLTGDGSTARDSEICVFCHVPATPSGASVTPLWQSDAQASYQYSTYDHTGVRDLGHGRVGSHSLACLSCHDALQAPSAGSVPIVRGNQLDHPIGVPYRGSLSGIGLESEYRHPSSASINGRLVWWISLRASGTRSRTDLPFFAGSSDTNDENVPFIECGTCHDPHTANRLFLRSDTQSLCMTCHVK